MIPGALHSMVMAAIGAFTVAKSFLTRPAGPTYFERTFGTPTSNIKWTASFWIRRSALYASRNYQAILAVATGGNSTLNFGMTNSDDSLGFSLASSNRRHTNTQIAQTSTYVHVTVNYDSAQGSDANRFKVWFGSTAIALTTDGAIGASEASQINSAVVHRLFGFPSQNYWYSGYMSEFCFVDGLALDYSYFEDGSGKPKSPVVSEWGANGCYLDFKDATSATTLGYDKAPISGLHTAANNWTPSNVLTSDQSTVVPP